MARDSLLAEARELAKASLGDSFDHGFPHVERVLRWAWKIVEAERLSVDPFVLEVSVLLHDVGRALGEPHAHFSALVARGFLESKGVVREVVDKVVNAILCHSYSYSKEHRVVPLGPEAMVLSDADKLDALGIVGFLRVFGYNWRRGRGIGDILEHFREKILNLQNMLYFEYSRRTARELTKRVERALNELCEELGCEQSSTIKAQVERLGIEG